MLKPTDLQWLLKLTVSQIETAMHVQSDWSLMVVPLLLYLMRTTWQRLATGCADEGYSRLSRLLS